ncbi:MAG: SDR family NAD(P)-dependent oxidoreductase [Candidatus Roizmanbacteria bacterium]|nr:SDR family NAD(P)-dependent oxidoreductase [Candidatus Roizmanbacteria bacterium]
MKLGIEGKLALVTGGATGIGKAIALELAREGVRVVVTSRSSERIDAAVTELNHVGSGHGGIVSSITDLGAPTQVVTEVHQQYGSIDIVVNNVGDTLGILDPLCTLDDWARLFRLIMGVAIEINNAVIPSMRERRWGRIVNITAGAGMENSGPVPYSSLKAAFTAYSRSLGRVLALENTGIVMSAVLPGVVLTEEGHWSEVLKTRPEHAEKYLQDRTVLRRFGKPEEISPMVALLCSELASFCIGSIVPVEGGQARHFFQKVDDS